MKIKKIFFVLIATVAILATLAINTFAYTDYGTSNYSLPSVAVYLVRDSSGSTVSYARDTNFEALNTATNSMTNYLGVSGGDVSSSVRTRWRYQYLGGDNTFDARFRFEATTFNENYNISMRMSPLPMRHTQFIESTQLYFQGYGVDSGITNNDFNFELGYDSPECKIVITWIDCRTSEFSFKQTTLQGINTSGNLITRISEAENIATNDLRNCFITDILIQVDGMGASYIAFDFYSRGFEFYRNMTNLEEGRYEYAYDLERVFEISYGDFYDEGYDEGYDDGFDDGVANAIEERGMFKFFIDSLGAFMDFPIFTLPEGGSISLGLLLGVIVGAMSLVWLLKLIAGG